MILSIPTAEDLINNIEDMAQEIYGDVVDLFNNPTEGVPIFLKTLLPVDWDI